MASDLIVMSPAGLYCPVGDFHIDPWRAVPTAVITHGHSDHSRGGMGRYITADEGVPILRSRLGEVEVRGLAYGASIELGDVRISLHPAGHVLGSAQVRIESAGEVWVVSGDYKRQADPSCRAFEPVECDVFVTESTFALPVYRWPDTAAVVAEIIAWRDECGQRGEAAVLYCYALGKAQRLLAEIAQLDAKPVYVHGALEAGNAIYREAGVPIAPTIGVTSVVKGHSFTGELIMAPPSAAGTPWLRRFGKMQQGFASGWMRLRGNRRRRNMDRGFVVSDHADWYGLLKSIDQSRARRVIAMHGYSDALARHLKDKGLACERFPDSRPEADE